MRRPTASWAVLLFAVACGSSSADAGGETTGSSSTDPSAGLTSAPSTTDSTSTSSGPDPDTSGSTGETTSAESGSSSSTGGVVPATCTVFVDGSTGDDADPGDTWGRAKATVTAGLAQAAMAGEPCDVWVAEGTYVPSSSDDPDETFQLVPDSGLYGGFAGTEHSLDARDLDAHETVLSGDIGVPGDLADNTHHVVTTAANSRLDGLTITAGHATDVPPFGGSGSGIYNPAMGPLVIAHCRIEGNRNATGDATAAGQPGWGGYGAGLYSANAPVTITDSAFVGNHAGDGGSNGTTGGFGGTAGGAYIVGDDISIERTVFVDNAAGDGGLGTTLNGGGQGGSGGGLHVTTSGAVRLVDVRFEGNVTGAGGYPDDPEFFRGVGGGLFLVTADGAGDLVIANAVFRSNSASAGAAFVQTNGGTSPQQVSIVNTVFSANTATVRGGGLFYSGDSDYALTIAQCSFEGNTAPAGGGLSYRNEAGGDQPASMVGTILWHDAASIGPEIDAVEIMGSTPLVVESSDVEGGCPVGIALSCDGTVLDLDPAFVDPASGDLRLGGDSPLLDQGETTLLPPDAGDLDADGDVDEPIPLDLDGNPRLVGPAPDLGAFEHP